MDLADDEEVKDCVAQGASSPAVMSLAGVIRGKPMRTTISDRSAPCPRDHVNRQFRAPAPDMLWVSDFTYVPT